MPRRTRLAIAIGAAVAVFALAALATTAGPMRPFTERPRTTSEPRRRTVETRPPVTVPPRDRARQDDASLAIDLLLRLLMLFVLGVVAYFAVRALIALLLAPRQTRRRRLQAGEGEMAVPAGAAELAAATEDGLRALETMAVDDAIIACWLRLEEAAADVGVARRPAETASDLTIRVLAAHDVPERPLLRLLALYREARFSGHHMPETARQEARKALTTVRTGLAGTARPDPRQRSTSEASQ